MAKPLIAPVPFNTLTLKMECATVEKWVELDLWGFVKGLGLGRGTPLMDHEKLILGDVDFPEGTHCPLSEELRVPLAAAREKAIKVMKSPEYANLSLAELKDKLLKTKRSCWSPHDSRFFIDLHAIGHFEGTHGVSTMQDKVSQAFPRIDAEDGDVEAVYNIVKSFEDATWWQYVDMDSKGIVTTVLETLEPLQRSTCPEDTLPWFANPWYEALRPRLERCAIYTADDGQHFGKAGVLKNLEDLEKKVATSAEVKWEDTKLINMWKFLLIASDCARVEEVTEKVKTKITAKDAAVATGRGGGSSSASSSGATRGRGRGGGKRAAPAAVPKDGPAKKVSKSLFG